MHQVTCNWIQTRLQNEMMMQEYAIEGSTVRQMLFLPVPAHLAAAICARHKTTTSLTDSPSSAAFPSIPSPFNTHYPPIALPPTEVTTVICTPVHPRSTIPFLCPGPQRYRTAQGDRNFPSFSRFLGISFPLVVPIDQWPPLLLASPHLVPWEAKDSFFRVGFVAELLICSACSCFWERRDLWTRDRARKKP